MLKPEGGLGGKSVKILKKIIIIKTNKVTYCVQTCSLIFIYNGMYTVCSYDAPHCTGQKQNRCNMCVRH